MLAGLSRHLNMARKIQRVPLGGLLSACGRGGGASHCKHVYRFFATRVESQTQTAMDNVTTSSGSPLSFHSSPARGDEIPLNIRK